MEEKQVVAEFEIPMMLNFFMAALLAEGIFIVAALGQISATLSHIADKIGG